MKQPDFNLMRIVGLTPKKNRIPAKYATFNHRMIAATLDTFIILLVIAPLVDAFFNYYYTPINIDYQLLQENMRRQPEGIAQLMVFWREMVSSGIVGRWLWNLTIQTAFLMIFTIVCWHFWSATPGKMIMHLRIADADTEAPITDRQIGLRIAGYFVSTFGLLIGFMRIGYDKRRQGWHDKMANTVVLVKPIRWPWKKKAKPDAPADNPSDSQEPLKAE